MEFLKSRFQSSLPNFYRAIRSSRDALLIFKDLPGRLSNPWWRDSQQRIKKYQNRYSGERCFVIGNGPSLRKTDISLLKNEFTFGMNRIYLAFQEWGFQTSFLVSVNDLVIEQCSQDFQDLTLPKFFSWRSRELLYPTGKPDPNTYFLNTTYARPRFNAHIQSRFWEGSTVTYVCLQLAFCMGFSEVYLIGVDHSFTTTGTSNTTVISTGNDPNHFSPDYFGKGFRWQLPDLDTSETAYQMALNHYQAAGKTIMDATIGGKLEVFPKVAYLSLFEGNH